MKLKTKLFASAVAIAMVASLAALPVSAQTTAELQAQIAQLLVLINQLKGQIAMQGGGAATGGTYTYAADLTAGSTGADVTALQQFLMGKGHSIPALAAGAAYGYFGPQTQAALAAYQASVGISPAVGYFGPITRAHMNAMVSTGGTTGGTATGGITTPGAEGTLTVTTNNAGLVSTVYEGDGMMAIYGLNVEAKNSDIAVQRVKVNLGTTTSVYTRGYSKIYVTEGGNVLASSDLNSSTVVKEGSSYFVTVTGFNLIVPKDSKKQIVLKADVMSSVDTNYRGALSLVSITIPANGIRGVDGAGIDQYGSSAALTGRTTTFSASLTDTASLTISLNSSSPKKNDIFATAGASENELDKATLAVFDLKAEKDNVTVTDFGVTVTKTGAGGANASTTVYLFDGSTELDNASLIGTGASGSYFNFADLDFVVPKNTTKTLTLKADIRSANGTVANLVGTASTTNLVTENTRGDTATESGSFTGYAQGVRNQGLEVALVSKSITTDGVPQGIPAANLTSTSTLTASFSIKVKAVGAAQQLGLTQATSSPLLSSTTSFSIFRNGAVVTDVGSAATSTSFTVDSICVTAGLTNTCSLAEGTEVTVPIAFQIQGRNPNTALTTGLYSVGIAALYSAGNTINFMSGESDWRTADVSFP